MLDDSHHKCRLQATTGSLEKAGAARSYSAMQPQTTSHPSSFQDTTEDQNNSKITRPKNEWLEGNNPGILAPTIIWQYWQENHPLLVAAQAAFTVKSSKWIHQKLWTMNSSGAVIPPHFVFAPNQKRNTDWIGPLLFWMEWHPKSQETSINDGCRTWWPCRPCLRATQPSYNGGWPGRMDHKGPNITRWLGLAGTF